MEKTNWSITSEYMGWTKEEFLFTYNEEEKQQNEVNKNNAWLVHRADFYPVYTQFLFLDVNATELMILSYLYYWTKNWGWIYTKNEDLAFISKASVSTVTRTLKELVKNWYINVDEKKLRMWTDRKMQVTTALVNLMSGKISINNWVKIKNIEEFLISTRQFDESYNNNKKNKNIGAPLDSVTPSINFSPKDKDNVTLPKNSALDIIKNSDDIRDILDEEEILQYKIQLKILLKMVELGYKIKKSKSDIENEIEWLKAKAKLYWLIQWDGNIAWQTFYQKIDKRFDWHIENNKKVKNFKTSIIPFISK